MSETKGHIDWVVLLSASFLMLMSSVFVYSASVGLALNSELTTGSIFMSHTSKVIAGIIIMIVVSQINYKIWQRISMYLMFLSLGLLFMVLVTKIGHSSHGAKRWINIGGFSFQPSEIAKVAMIIHFSDMLVRNKEKLHSFKQGLVPFLIWLGAICLMIALQPNFSTTMVIFGIAMLLLFVGNVNIKYLLATVGVGLLGGFAFGLTASYRWHRIMAFIGVEENVNTQVNHQIEQSLIAIGNGGFSGVGIGQSRQSHLFLPEAHSDFIFSIIGEEYGFIGIAVMMLLFGVIVWRGFKIAKNAPDEYGYFLGAGVVIVFSMYVIINSGVCLGLLPTTGLPLPFISYGGTAILINSATIGILLNISAKSGMLPRNPGGQKNKKPFKPSPEDD